MSVPHRHAGVGVTEKGLCSSQAAQAHLDVAGKRMPEPGQTGS